MAAQKDTIYIDVDDEITTIVDKVNASNSKILALVLPKRAAALQSIVNMKLLKRTADDANKRVVLITSEAGLLPLAGAIGMYVAKNLQSKPEIPAAPEMPSDEDELLETEAEGMHETSLNKSTPVGELVDEDDIFENTATATPTTAKKSRHVKKPANASAVKGDKKNRIPNFEKFRLKVIIGVVAAMALLGLGYLGFFVLPKAIVVVKTETSTQNASIDFTASPSVQTLDVEAGIVPAKEVESQKTETQKAPATGQKDLGSKATGSVMLSAECSPSTLGLKVPRGTGISANNLTFITQEDAVLSTLGAGCKFTDTVTVAAKENGDQYNIASGRTFSVAGFSNVSATNNSNFTGGSSKIAKVVSQQDIDSAKQKISDNSQTVKTELKKQLEDQGYYAIEDTFATKKDDITSSPGVDQEASEVTVTANRVYAMTGVKRDDLRSLIDNAVKDETERRQLQVQNDGLDDASFRIGNRQPNGSVSITLQAQVALGPKINQDQLKKDIAGNKRGDVQNKIKEIDGVRDVEVNFSPFWVSSIPKNTNKITLEIKEAE
jgi:hypothetical protein